MIWYTNQSCRGGGIGRRAGFKIRCWQQHEGSSPSLGTRKINYFDIILPSFFQINVISFEVKQFLIMIIHGI